MPSSSASSAPAAGDLGFRAAKTSRAEQEQIDATARWPVLAFLASGLFWLLVGGAMQLAASIQTHSPAFLAECEWLTHGRLAPAAQNALVYGWGFNAAFAVGLWLMARLSAAALRHGGWLLVAGKFWNIGVLLGVGGILAGWSTSYELLEFPRHVVLLLLASYALIGVWMVTTFSVRNTGNVYASQWYLLAAAFFFPWLYSIAQVMLFKAPVAGTLQAIVNAWYVSGLYTLFFVPLGLAVAYYFLPKLLGRPVNLYYAAALGFWWFIAVGVLMGGVRLINAPVPVWVPTLGIAAALLLILPVIIIGLNLLGALGRDLGRTFASPTLSFVALSIVSFLLWGGLTILTSTRGVAAGFQFTIGPAGLDWLALYGCFSLAAFGAACFIVPRLTGREWASPALIKAHLWSAVLGLGLFTAASLIGGFRHGALLNDPAVPFPDIAQALAPWLAARSVALMLLLVGHLAFLPNLFWALCPIDSGKAGAAVFAPPPDLKPAAGEARS